MFSIVRATETDVNDILLIGKISVEEAHRDSCSKKDLNEYLEKNYNYNALLAEIHDTNNIYHVLKYQEKTIGFSKIILNEIHSNIASKNVTKLDRIYLLKEYYDLKLGFELLQYNKKFAQKNNQSGMWLYTWVGNSRAIEFYLKNNFTIIGSHLFKVSNTHSNENHHMWLDFENDYNPKI